MDYFDGLERRLFLALFNHYRDNYASDGSVHAFLCFVLARIGKYFDIDVSSGLIACGCARTRKEAVRYER